MPATKKPIPSQSSSRRSSSLNQTPTPVKFVDDDYVSANIRATQSKTITRKPPPVSSQRVLLKPRPTYESESESDSESASESDISESDSAPVIEIDDKIRQVLLQQISSWMDYDDTIKTLNSKSKKYKDLKKQQETKIVDMIDKYKIGNTRLDIPGKDATLRGRVYKQKSVTKEPLSEAIIKNVLMEIEKDEAKVDDMLAKINNKRRDKERYYLKRTKGNE